MIGNQVPTSSHKVATQCYYQARIMLSRVESRIKTSEIITFRSHPNLPPSTHSPRRSDVHSTTQSRLLNRRAPSTSGDARWTSQSPDVQRRPTTSRIIAVQYAENVTVYIHWQRLVSVPGKSVTVQFWAGDGWWCGHRGATTRGKRLRIDEHEIVFPSPLPIEARTSRNYHHPKVWTLVRSACPSAQIDCVMRLGFWCWDWAVLVTATTAFRLSGLAAGTFGFARENSGRVHGYETWRSARSRWIFRELRSEVWVVIWGTRIALERRVE